VAVVALAELQDKIVEATANGVELTAQVKKR